LTIKVLRLRPVSKAIIIQRNMMYPKIAHLDIGKRAGVNKIFGGATR
jgi:hypothetical protein